MWKLLYKTRKAESVQVRPLNSHNLVVTHDFLTDLTTSYQSHDFPRYNKNIIILCALNTIQMSRDPDGT